MNFQSSVTDYYLRVTYYQAMSELLKNLNEQQKEAVVFDHGPLLIVAGAGTGKTTVITTRIANLIESGKCNPDQILALTFTDKAAGEMEERVDKLLPYGYVDLWISTFHAFAERILKEHGTEIGLPGDFKLLSTTGQWMLVKNNLAKFDLAYYKPLGNPTKHIHNLISHFSRLKDENVGVGDYQKYLTDLEKITDFTKLAGELLDSEIIDELDSEDLNIAVSDELKKLKEIGRAYETYQQLLLDNNVLDFGDLINYTLKLFQERKNILAKYRAQFKYILVDEFQDTNFAQYELIKLLASPKNNITVVGDDDQAIYKFRGASIANILQFKDDFKNAKEIFLNQNYRSAQNILDLAYQFIQQNNPYRLEIKLAAEKKQGLNKKLSANIKENGEIIHLHGETLEDEVELVVKKLIETYNQHDNWQWSDLAILIRANSSANDLMYVLEQAKVPYNFIASRGLYSKKIVLDILAFLKLLDDYHESVAMHRILAMPIFGVEHKDILNFNYLANRKGYSLFEALHRADEEKMISAEGKKKVKGLMNLLTEFSREALNGQRTAEIIQEFMDKSGYLKYLTENESEKNRAELAYLNHFFKKVQDFEKENSDKSVKNFLALIELELESGEEGGLPSVTDQEDPNTVKIMTIHASKGLEFEYVFLPNMVDKRFPTIAKGEAIKLPDKLIKEITPEGDVHLQEERRLFYVAMTRAKRGLCFSSAENYGGARKKKISRFLQELADQGFVIAKEAAEAENKIAQAKDKTAKQEYKPLPPKKYSFTRLKAFETCPYQYHFAFVWKIPTKGKPQFSFGRTMHTTMQRVFQLVAKRIYNQQPELLPQDNKKNIDWEEIENIYQGSFIDDWFPDQKTKQEYWDRGLKSLKDFYEQNNANWPKAKFLEYPFNLHVKSGVDNYTLYGVVDRIDQVDGGLRIVDYKTSNPKSKLTLEDKEQLLIYQMAVADILKEPVKELVFHYFEDNSEVSFLGKDKELEKIREKIVVNIEGIKAGEFPPKPSMMCRYCDYGSICDYRE